MEQQPRENECWVLRGGRHGGRGGRGRDLGLGGGHREPRGVPRRGQRERGELGVPVVDRGARLDGAVLLLSDRRRDYAGHVVITSVKVVIELEGVSLVTRAWTPRLRLVLLVVKVKVELFEGLVHQASGLPALLVGLGDGGGADEGGESGESEETQHHGVSGAIPRHD